MLLPYQQYLRIKRIDNVPFFLLDNEIFEDKLILKISGSTLNVYTIEINEKTQNLSCDCIDFQTKCLRENLYCKHICFVYRRIGQIMDDNLFIEKRLSISEYSKILERLSNINSNIRNEYLSNRYYSLKDELKENVEEKDVFDKENSRNIEEDCPICYETLKENKLVTCPSCNNSIHDECMKMWLKMKTTCVFCRSDIWKSFNKPEKKSTKYLNIS